MTSAEHPTRLILLMGVAGSGKTTLGNLLAGRLGYLFLDADDFHNAEAVARMRSGTPLTDDLRDAWVDRLEAALTRLHQQGAHSVLAFSGLRARHRRQLMKVGFATTAFMLEGGNDLLAQRLGRRDDHFMPASLLQHQLDAMEPVQADEQIELIDVRALPQDIVAALVARVAR